jgi:hypothetical protein
MVYFNLNFIGVNRLTTQVLCEFLTLDFYICLNLKRHLVLSFDQVIPNFSSQFSQNDMFLIWD